MGDLLAVRLGVAALLTILASLAAPAGAAGAEPPKLTLDADGVSLDAGVAGKFTLPPPKLTARADDYDGKGPVWTLRDTTHATARYADGFELGVSLGAAGIHYTFDRMPTDMHALRFTLLVPIRFAQGGQFAFDEAPYRPFPARLDKTFLFQGQGRQLRLLDPSGEGFSLGTPAYFQEMSDNRAYHWAVFAHVFSYIFKEHGTEQAFDLAIAPLQEAAPRFVVDRFGQFANREYPGKITSEQELKDDAARDAREAQNPGALARDTYGGWPGSVGKDGLRRTGYFHTGQVGTHQVFVTPEGNAFFQLGVCGIGASEGMTLVRGREKVFEWLPPKTGEFATAWFKEDPQGVMSFYVANVIRKEGAPFDLEKWSAKAIARLRRWGFNSAGAFSAYPEAMKTALFPYSSQLPLEPWMTKGLKPMQGATRTYDPFAPGVEAVLDRAFAEQVAPHADDPNIIGYFLENEVLYEDIRRTVPGQRGDSPSKRRFVELLKERYGGDLGKWQTAWGVAGGGQQGFADLNDAPLFVNTPAARADVEEFMRLFLETHYALVARLFRKYDPHHLLLGSRWQPGTAGDELLVRTAAKYLDVVSVNYYTRTIDPAFLRRIDDWSGGKPMLLSEWHYTADDLGMGGGQTVANQQARGLAYRDYVRAAAALPFVVGHQWFTYTDQPVTGRWFEGYNGEAANTGLVNGVDRPYADFVAACKQTNDAIYETLFKVQPPP